MNAYLIYRKEEAEKNREFIRLFEEAGRKYDIVFCTVSYSEYKEQELPDIVLNRTRDRNVSAWYEGRGVTVLHSSRITEIGNDKWKTLEYLKRHLAPEILAQEWCPDTVYVPKEQFKVWRKAVWEKDYAVLYEQVPFCKKGDFVLKSVDGHGGQNVLAFPELHRSGFLQEEQYWQAFLEKIHPLEGKNCLLQELVPSAGRDIRVYILGNQVYRGILRQGKDDFRSNFSLGGQVTPYDFSERELHWIEAFLRAFDGKVLGLAGIDFLLAEDGRLVFNELEEMVGCRMLYQSTECDIVGEYMEWIWRNKVLYKRI